MRLSRTKTSSDADDSAPASGEDAAWTGFAAAALHAVISVDGSSSLLEPDTYALHAARMADAMLKQWRKRRLSQ